MALLKGAIVGFGNIAALGHWPTYAASQDVEIVAIVDPSPERQTHAKTLRPAIRNYDSIDALLEKEELDFIDLCTPPSSHVKLALQALQKSIHVLCEKPLALSVADYATLATAAEKSGKTVFTVHNWKYAPIFKEALDLLRQGTIGAVWHAEIFTLRNSHCKGAVQGAATNGAAEDWRKNRAVAGGGILIDHGWHSFYLLLNVIGEEPKKILAKMQTGSEEADALEEAVQALVQFPNADGYLHMTWQAPTRHNSMVIQGRQGTLLIDDDRLLLTTHDGKREEKKFDAALSAGSHHADWFKTLFPDFLAEVANVTLRGRNLKEAGWCAALTAAAYDSNRRGFQEVDVTFPSTTHVGSS
jgi:predicted dehydrogenase